MVAVLAATDPAQAYGAALPWPKREGETTALDRRLLLDLRFEDRIANTLDRAQPNSRAQGQRSDYYRIAGLEPGNLSRVTGRVHVRDIVGRSFQRPLLG